MLLICFNNIPGVPTEPWNVTAIQKNGSHILISWNKPTQANGQITNYKICWYPPMPSIKLKLSGNETSHLLAADFQQNIKYTFYVSVYHYNLFDIFNLIIINIGYSD